MHGTAGTITKGDWGQAVFSTPQIPDRVSCSTKTTSPLFLCLLIPGISRHGCVMTEMISPPRAPTIGSTPPAPPTTASSNIPPSIDPPSDQNGLTSSVISVLASPSALTNPTLPLFLLFQSAQSNKQHSSSVLVLSDFSTTPRGKEIEDKEEWRKKKKLRYIYKEEIKVNWWLKVEISGIKRQRSKKVAQSQWCHGVSS